MKTHHRLASMTLLLLSVLTTADSAFAQAEIDELLRESSETDAAIQSDKGGETKNNSATPPKSTAPAPGALNNDRVEKVDLKIDPGNVSNLAVLDPFNDIAVIQRKFLPRTHRFEAFPGLGMVINNAFFINVTASARLGYAFTETWGVEANVGHIGSTDRQVTKDLKEKRGVATKSLVNPQLFYGLDARWNPFYGKFGWMNKAIVPFDTYFVAGLGLTQTNQDQSPLTFHVGGGQLFAISKSMAVRWDLSGYFYRLAAASGGTSGGNFNDIHLTVGMSFFFPGAKYR